ncbi:hypothetical protein FAZ78_16950 [Cereibacter changlensis]|uniref:Antitoxin VbhA domain-containing protein n=1 Tax=Cereibacter changlensis TaxID=402884 RepID=A0A4U0Z1X8_9RHOB|nr:antitoxin VbhA family protein [Cereibacter changlensis]TKA95423.1 hypothetical protein FAZ78_16950 [Cereibacter changlensis]
MKHIKNTYFKHPSGDRSFSTPRRVRVKLAGNARRHAMRIENPVTIQPQQRAERSRMLASAVASQRIEGLELDAQSKRDFHALEGGELSASELRARLLSRYSRTGASR